MLALFVVLCAVKPVLNWRVSTDHTYRSPDHERAYTAYRLSVATNRYACALELLPRSGIATGDLLFVLESEGRTDLTNDLVRVYQRCTRWRVKGIIASQTSAMHSETGVKIMINDIASLLDRHDENELRGANGIIMALLRGGYPQAADVFVRFIKEQAYETLMPDFYSALMALGDTRCYAEARRDITDPSVDEATKMAAQLYLPGGRRREEDSERE